MDRAAATFQDRLVTELRLAGAATITEAEEVLNSFLPRFNEKFGVQAEQSIPAYRRLEQSVPLNRILCFKHRRKVSRDNTIKYNRRTLQLLPCRTRPTYAGVHRFVEIAASNATMPMTTACGNAGTVTLTGIFMAGTQ